MIRRSQSKELVASMREAEELANALTHYEAQRVRWTEEHSEKTQEFARDRSQRDGFREQFLALGSTLKNVVREIQDRTLTNAELLGRMVKRGQDLLQEIIRAKGRSQQFGAKSDDPAPSLFLDQRV